MLKIKIQQACILPFRDIMWKYRTKAVFHLCAHTEFFIVIIDEPISPSVDREAAPIPPSAVISVAPSITTGPSSPGSPCPPIRRQLSHDQGKQHWVGWVMDVSVMVWLYRIPLERTKYTSLKFEVVYTLWLHIYLNWHLLNFFQSTNQLIAVAPAFWNIGCNV